ncbi:MAG: glutamine--fructose-6-phosphate transaminase (isomerizing) [Candidatus Hydrogenedentes bacterium]|nr:glutamine--fructose-6-phosphate transaminase (isomerizing) [Candidatus Hydrogenedentota bacterium]
MCGIVGYIGGRSAVGMLMPGLKRLEYRGYDSAGLATVSGGTLYRLRRTGKLANLDAALTVESLPGDMGIGHTRWATHGPPTEANAHPHVDGSGEIAVVHNGIIENSGALRAELQAAGVVFASDTDTEVLPHLIRAAYAGDLAGAVRQALARVEGSYAIAVIHSGEPDVLVAARHGSPLIIGVGEGEHWVASDVPAILPLTRTVVYMRDGEVARLTRTEVRLEDLAGVRGDLRLSEVTWEVGAVEKEGYPHYMLKEIYQQPDVIRHALVSYTDAASGRVLFPDVDEKILANVDRMILVACGTAWHAALVGKYWIEAWARIPAEVDFASEFRYRSPVLSPKTLMVAVSQSGETADTLEAVRLARAAGAPVLAIVNAVGSSIAREADAVIYTHAGPEIGVASTKAYTAQLAVLALLAICLAAERDTLAQPERSGLLQALADIPPQMGAFLADPKAVEILAAEHRYLGATHAMFIGRGYNYPSALEGALKLKEISYIHVEGYAAGEMKHGPIALVTEGLPVVAIAVQGAVYEKVLSNIAEVRARGGTVLAIATAGDSRIYGETEDVIEVPSSMEAFSPLLVALPLQLFAYHVAHGLGRDVDQPRNLAKSVTVE